MKWTSNKQIMDNYCTKTIFYETFVRLQIHLYINQKKCLFVPERILDENEVMKEKVKVKD